MPRQKVSPWECMTAGITGDFPGVYHRAQTHNLSCSTKQYREDMPLRCRLGGFVSILGI